MTQKYYKKCIIALKKNNNLMMDIIYQANLNNNVSFVK